jgi:hypothetical protein
MLTPTAPTGHSTATSQKTARNRGYSRFTALYVNRPDVREFAVRGVDRLALGAHALKVTVSSTEPQVRFEQEGSQLTAIEITRAERSPVIAMLQRTLFALGVVVSSYQARAGATRLVERIVIERTDGGSIDGALSVATKAAILPIALQHGFAEPDADS